VNNLRYVFLVSTDTLYIKLQLISSMISNVTHAGQTDPYGQRKPGVEAAFDEGMHCMFFSHVILLS